MRVLDYLNYSPSLICNFNLFFNNITFHLYIFGMYIFSFFKAAGTVTNNSQVMKSIGHFLLSGVIKTVLFIVCNYSRICPSQP